LTFIASLIAALIIGLVIGLLIRRRNATPSNDLPSQENINATHQTVQASTPSIFALANDQGNVQIYGSEIRKIPNGAHHLDLTNDPIKKMTQLLADSFKGATSTSKKTLEIVFKPEIQEGLSDGAYRLMKTKPGDVLADAIDSTTGKIVGKARVIETGKIKQMAAGAFQIISIAVAQAHLADIERSLGGINRAISQLKDDIDSLFISNIVGAEKYLRQIAEKINSSVLPENLSEPQKNTLETISKDAYIALAQIEESLNRLTIGINSIVNKDLFGTSDCYTQFTEVAEKFKELNTRRSLLVDLASLTNIIMAYQDPIGQTFTRVTLESDRWYKLLAAFSKAFIEKSDALFSNDNKTNSKEMLTFRREKVQSLVLVSKTEALALAERFETTTFNLNKNSRGFLGQEAEVALAISLDNNGIVENAAIL
jgi:hypothetical protein